jgi:hypothetical protein
MPRREQVRRVMKVNDGFTPPSLPVGTEKTHGIRRPDIQRLGHIVTSGAACSVVRAVERSGEWYSVPIYCHRQTETWCRVLVQANNDIITCKHA